MPVITLPDRFGIAQFESLLDEWHRTTERANSVEFDLRRTTWGGMLPFCLLVQWIQQLRARPFARPKVILNVGPSPTPVIRVLLGDLGLAAASGAEVRGALPVSRREGTFPWRALAGSDDLLGIAKDAADRLMEANAEEMAAAAAQLVLTQLAENAVAHAGARGASFAFHIGTAGPTRGPFHRGLMFAFPEGQRYIEIYLGDRGPGIAATLRAAASAAGTEASPHTDLTANERVLRYAFEWGSTSDQASRMRRLTDALADSARHIESSQLATGLSRIRSAVRDASGELLLRDAGGILRLRPTATGELVGGASRLGRTAVAAGLRGASIIVRIPLSTSPTVRAIRAPQVVTPVSCFIGSATPVATPARARAEFIDAACRWLSGGGDGALSHVVYLNPWLFSSSAVAEVAIRLLARSHLPGRTLLIHAAGEPLVGDIIEPEAGTPAAFGDLQRNALRTVARTDPEGGVWQLSDNDWREVQRALNEGLGATVGRAAITPPVLRAGTFVLQYGDGDLHFPEFIEASRLLRHPVTRDLVIDWFLGATGRDIASISLVGPAFGGLTDMVARRAAAIFRRHVPVYLVQDPKSEDCVRSALETMPLGPTSIWSDVVCTGEVLNRVLAVASRNGPAEAITLVDAGERPLPGRFQGERATIPLRFAALRPIRPAPSADLSSGTPVYYIDPGTLRATRYAWERDTHLTTEDFLDAIGGTPGAIRWGHWAYGSRHYTFFLDLPKCWSSVRERFGAWLSDALSAVDTPDSRAAFAVFAPLESFGGLEQLLAPELRGRESLELTASDLAVPPLHGSSVSPSWLVLVPAMASGSTVRRVLRFFSGLGALRVVVLVGVSRMPPDEAQFITNVESVGGCRTEVRIFAELTIPSFAAGQADCPCCRLIDTMQARLPLRGSEDTESWFASRHARPVAAFGAVGSAETADDARRNQTRALVRHLYERAAAEPLAARQLTALLRDDDTFVRFIEVVSNESAHSVFGASALAVRLGTSAARALGNRLELLIGSASAPYPVGRVAFAAANLIPLWLGVEFGSIIARFVSSPPDIEDLAYAVAGARVTVTAARPSVESDEAAARLDNVWQMFRSDEAPMQVFGAIQQMMDALRRSHRFLDRLPASPPVADTDEDRWLALRAAVATAVTAWEEMKPVTRCLRTSRLLMHSSVQGAVCTQIGDLDALVHGIARGVERAFDPVRNGPLAARVLSDCEAVRLTAAATVIELGRFSPSPSHWIAAAIESAARSFGGSLTIRWPGAPSGLPAVFIGDGDLKFALDQLLANALRHGAGEVSISIRADGEHVAIAVQNGLPPDWTHSGRRSGVEEVRLAISRFGATLHAGLAPSGSEWASTLRLLSTHALNPAR